MLDNNLTTFIKSKFVTTSWSNPRMEGNVVIIPKLLNPRVGSRIGLVFNRVTYNMPTKTDIFDVFNLEVVPQEVFLTPDQSINKWIPLGEYSGKYNLLLRLTNYITGEHYSHTSTYIMFTNKGNCFIATANSSIVNRDKVMFRIRSNVYNSPSKANIDSITFKDSTELGSWLFNYNNDADKHLKEHLVNGVYKDTLTIDDLEVGDEVTVIHDELTETKLSYPLNDLTTCESNGELYYMVQLDPNNTTTNQILHRSDLVLYLQNSNSGNGGSFYLEISTQGENLVQIIDDVVGIKTSYIEGLLNSRGWFDSETTLITYVRYDNAHMEYVNNDGYWHSYKGLPNDLRMQVLGSVSNIPSVWQGANQIGSPYNKLLSSFYNQLSSDKLSDGMSVGTLDYYINRGILPISEVGNNLADYAPTEEVTYPLYTYMDGLVSAVSPNTIQETDNFVMLGYSNEQPPISTEVSTNIEDFKRPVVWYVDDDGSILIARENTHYRIMAEQLLVLPIISEKPLLVGDLYSTARYTPSNSSIQQLPVDVFNPILGYNNLVVGDKTLTFGIDYIVSATNLLSIWSKDALIQDNPFIRLTQQLTLNDAIVETGFTRNGSLSIDGRYLELDPGNHVIVVDGVIYNPSELVWDDEYIQSTEGELPNAKPYSVIKLHLNNFTSESIDVKSVRDAHNVNLMEIADFKNANLPKVEKPNSLYPDHYELISPFMLAVTDAVMAGDINVSPGVVLSSGLDNILVNYLYIINDGLDPIAHDLEWSVIELLGHEETYRTVTLNMYNFLESVNQKYFNGIIQMNTHYRVG